MMTSEQIDALWQIDDPEQGLYVLEQALRENPDSSDELHTQICRSLGLLGKFDEGWAELAKVSGQPNDIVKIRVELEAGRLKNSSGDKEGALTYFLKALALAEEKRFDFFAVDAAHMIAIATEGAESIRWNERALAMAAASADPRARNWRGSLLNNLGWTYHDAGELLMAMDKFQAALAFRQETGNAASQRIARWAIARCHRSMNQYDEALTILQDLIRYPEAGYVSEEIAENLLAVGKTDEAKRHFKRAYDLLSEVEYLKDHEPVRLQRLYALGM
jgi:tetratricopeptide (TPR) repeat protein